MVFKRILPSMMILLAAGSMLLGGCSSNGSTRGRLVTGSVDMVKVLQYDEEYQKLAQEYFQERVRKSSQLEQVVKAKGGTIDDQATYDKFIKLDRELNDNWLKKTREFTGNKLAEVQGASARVCQEKGIDIVLLDSSEVPTIEYGGIDISADIIGELPGMAGGDQPDSTQASPASQASPATE